MNKEIEIKIKADTQLLQVIKAWLKKNATYAGTVDQEDHYLDNPKSTFFYQSDWRGKETDNYLRVRKTHGKNYLCLKKVHRKEEGRPYYADEYEIVVDDPDKALKLMEALGYVDVTILKKTREIYNCDVFEIAIDTVEGLGVFIEVELKKQVDDVASGYELILGFLRSMGVKKFRSQPQGYVHQKWNPGLDLGKDVEI